MFYSDSLLSKTGPLARVWLAANLDRKLSKAQVLSSDIPQDINAIVNQGQAPMALRLSGQLMLGVVRIYGKKAKYLQDDCHEALLKIRMTFRNTGNHDLPNNAGIGLDLNLPDLLTIDDLFPSMDFAYPLTQQPALEGPSQDFDQDWTSTLNPQQSTQSRLSPEVDVLVNDDDLGLDFGDRDDFEPNDTTVSIEQGRNAPAERGLEDEVLGGEGFYKDDDLNLDFGDDNDMVPQTEQEMTAMAQEGPDGMLLGDDETALLRQGAEAPRDRQVDSPLSEANSEALRDTDNTFNQDPNDTTLTEIGVRQPQRSKKLKPIVPDAETVLHNREIKAQSEDRSKILKAPSFLPRDPVLLALQNMQRNGDFVTSAMNDGASRHWAPELQGLLSFEAVFRSGPGRKRKRDSGIGGLSEDEDAHSQKSPRLEQDDEGLGMEQHDQGPVEHEPIDELNPTLEDMVTGEDDEGIFADGGDDVAFDDTSMPLVHPADSGPVSLGTKRAVHLLRDKLGGSADGQSPKKSVLLQELVPERSTSREEATKMFFEVLVLATKDAVKVEQGNKAIGMPLRIRGKRGLWGSWAEEAREDEEDEAAGMDALPGSRVQEVAA